MKRKVKTISYQRVSGEKKTCKLLIEINLFLYFEINSSA